MLNACQPGVDPERVGRRLTSQALTLRSLVLGYVVSHGLRRTGSVPERTPLLRVRILHQAINLPPFMIVWQILGNWETCGVHKQ